MNLLTFHEGIYFMELVSYVVVVGDTSDDVTNNAYYYVHLNTLINPQSAVSVMGTTKFALRAVNFSCRQNL